MSRTDRSKTLLPFIVFVGSDGKQEAKKIRERFGAS
jgi:hypothetical protein